jgi:hypothetical protein
MHIRSPIEMRMVIFLQGRSKRRNNLTFRKHLQYTRPCTISSHIKNFTYSPLSIVRWAFRDFSMVTDCYIAKWELNPSLSQASVFFFFFFGGTVGFELRASCLQSRNSMPEFILVNWSSPPVHFADGILRAICLGWSWTVILLISASQVARITGINHRYPPHSPFSFYYSIIA